MLASFKTHTKRVAKKLGIELPGFRNPVDSFHSHHYLRHNARRLEHLASLGIPISGMTVLEVGAGIGDHSHFYLDRGCTVTITEARPENIAHLRKRYPQCEVRFLDMETPEHVDGSPFDIVHCYGLLYHLSRPQEALAFMARSTRRFLFLETCVSFGNEEQVNLTGEPRTDPTQALSGTGCRPTRPWLYKQLQNLFEYVYVPLTQPSHEEFPTDWTTPHNHKAGLQRAVFIASRERLDTGTITPELIQQQRHR